MAETGSFTAAADLLPISQSGLSQQVRRLERLLGVSLFDRNSRNVKLTPVGTTLLPMVQELLDAEDALLAAARAQSTAEPASLRLFMAEDGNGALVVELVDLVRSSVTNLRVEVVNTSIANQPLVLQAGGSHDALIERTPSLAAVGPGRRTRLRAEPMCLVVPDELEVGESVTVAEAAGLDIRPMNWLPEEWLDWFPLLRGTGPDASADVLVVSSFRGSIQSVVLDRRCCVAPVSVAQTMVGLGCRIVMLRDGPTASLDLVTVGDGPLLEVLHTQAKLLASPSVPTPATDVPATVAELTA